MMLRPAQRLFINKANHTRNVSCIRSAVAYYSRRSGSESSDVYKTVKAGKGVEEALDDSLMSSNPNWELLSPRGYRFYLPGSVGPAWHDQSSTTQLEEVSGLMFSTEPPSGSKHNMLECVAQECPLLLRRGVLEMFPGMKDAGGSRLTIVTLTQKSEKSVTRDVTEIEGDKLARNFVLAAQEICTKLKLAGYWADFINPFSGLPYSSPTFSSRLYENDPRFRCLGFEIMDWNDCKVIGSQKKISNKFIGSLFTTAPANMRLLKEVFYQYE